MLLTISFSSSFDSTLLPFARNQIICTILTIITFSLVLDIESLGMLSVLLALFYFLSLVIGPLACDGVVGWCEGAVYLTSLGRPTDIGLQLGKACYPCSG